ncbi:MAG TPA: hypothetical protein VEF71_06620, partial [Streptosporangiaceae bacterium]|nr:hypothetical protein [Streptosporangiaceae bacterium]
MTAFALTERQQGFAAEVRVIAAEQLRPLAEAGRPGHVNRELVKALGELGLLPRLFPRRGSPLQVDLREFAAGHFDPEVVVAVADGGAHWAPPASDPLVPVVRPPAISHDSFNRWWRLPPWRLGPTRMTAGLPHHWGTPSAARAVTSAKPSRRQAISTSGSGTEAVSTLT